MPKFLGFPQSLLLKFFLLLTKAVQNSNSILYDYPEAIKTVADKIFDKVITKDSYSKFFCSKLVGAIYLQAGIITPEMLAKSGFKCVSELTPADCCSLPIFKDNIKLTSSEPEAKNVASKN